jgi:hypothetical protein
MTYVAPPRAELLSHAASTAVYDKTSGYER